MADDASFDAFYAATRRRLLGQLTLITGDRDQAQDLLQEAYLRAWQRWGRVEDLDDPAGWVRRVALRLWVSRWRRTVVALRARPQIARPEATASPASEVRMDVRAALARLPEGQRLVIVLHELCELSIPEVVAETGLAAGTVKSRLSRGRAALAQMVELSDSEVSDVHLA